MQENNVLKNRVHRQLQTTVLQYCRDNSIPDSDLKIRIEYSRDEKFGDYSTSLALENKKIFNQNPLELAEDLVKYIVKNDKEGMFRSVTVSKPGFINFRLSIAFLLSYITEHYSTSSIFPVMENRKKIIFEFVSANPTGPLNVVSARAAAMGDAISELLIKTGNSVFREFYVNDYGNQVLLLGVACLFRIRESLGENCRYQEEGEELTLDEMLAQNILPLESYRGDYVSAIANHLQQETDKNRIIQELLQKKDYLKLAQILSEWAVAFNLQSQKKDLQEFGVIFDKFYSEKELHQSGKVMSVLQDLEKQSVIYEENNKKVFNSTKYGDDKDRVVVRDDGRPTYLLADIAYHKTKMDRGFEKIFNIWGPDHHGYIARLKGAMQSLGFPAEDFQIILAQQVQLLENGQKLKMSKRLGQFQTMPDLFTYLGRHYRDVGRYFFLMRTLDAPLDFDLDLARDESDKNPVFYLQYAHARICSIFREIGEKSDSKAFLKLELTDERERLLFWVARFPEEVLDAAIAMEPHRFINYLQNLAHAFSRFYIQKENRLKDNEDHVQSGLGFLIQATQTCLFQGLSLLGISAPSRMEQDAKA